MHGGTNDLCVEELSAGESSATRTKGGGDRIGPQKSAKVIRSRRPHPARGPKRVLQVLS
jgi:hypothetical protein